MAYLIVDDLKYDKVVRKATISKEDLAEARGYDSLIIDLDREKYYYQDTNSWEGIIVV